MSGGNPNHDETGKFSSAPGGGASESAKRAIDWIRSPEAAAAILRIAAPERIKSAATLAIQGALFKLGGVNDPGVDAMIRHQVQTMADDLRVTRAHARQVALSIVRSMLRRGDN